MIKYIETLKESKMTLTALIFLIVFWLIAGFGTSNVDVTFFNIPLWAILGTVGVWLCGVIIAVLLSRSIKDINLDNKN